MSMKLHAAAIALLFALLAPGAYAQKVTIDGRIDPAEWAGAEHVTDFKLTEPLTLAPSPYPTEAWILSTPEGLAIGFRNTQPASVPRTRQRTQRDQDGPVDRVNLMIDFDGDGRAGYNFTVNLTGGYIDATINNERSFSKDWDANWTHAVSEEGDTWSVEMLVPWYVAPMAKADANGKRTVGIYLDRVIGSTNERVAWPDASYQRPRFLSDFYKLQLPAYSQALIAVTPYVTAGYDILNNRSYTDTGADILWKPNGQMQLTATINPDFGQVESDNLVVNFSANETFFSDKRPFFTENQGIFEFSLPSDSAQMLYTRRVGGPADDGSGPGDITAAVKLNGNLGGYKYGLFAADEADPAGRLFTALRLTRDFESQNVGLMITQVDRPYLDRKATVLGVDQNWRPTPKLSVTNRFVYSDVDVAGVEITGSGFTSLVEYEMEDGWRQQWLGMHFDDSLQMNDFGYLSRANLNYAHWLVAHRVTDFAKESRYSSRDWRWRVSATNNDHGLELQRQVRMNVFNQRKDGGNEFAQININADGYDDRILRGNGYVRFPSSWNFFAERYRPRKGNWELYGNVNVFKGGIGDDREIGWRANFNPTYYFTDAFSLYANFYAERTPNWTIWQYDNLVSTFDESAVQFDAGVNWSIGENQELRVKLQALGLDAPLRQAFRAAPDGTPVESSEFVEDFSLSQLGFQIRYRRELAPLSDLYIVYGRGGDIFNEYSDDARDLMRDAFELRDSDQILIKVSYRFDK